ncbi:MAG: TolC family protein [Selenomonadaceae bacterium]|nr:TolC family protein [Selenomonadaceae bacterium]
MENRYKGMTMALCLALAVSGRSVSAQDVSLQDAIDIALAQNTDLLITQKGEDTAASTLATAKGQNGFKASASGDVLHSSKTEGSNRADSSSLGLSGSLPLYTGGANEAKIKSGEIGLESSRLTTERKREDLKLSVIKAFYNALEARKTIDVDQESVDNYQAHYTNVSQLYSAGSKARIDVLRSSVELSNAKQTLIKAQNAYEVDLSTLRNLLNMDRTVPLNLTTDFSYDKFDIGMDDAIAYAYRNRKDLKVAEYDMKQKELAITSAKAGYQPELSLSVGTNVIDKDWHPSTDNKTGISAGVGLSWNLFDSGVTKAEVQEAKNQYDIAKLSLLKDKEDIDLSLRQSYYNMREAEKRFTSTTDAVNQAEEDYYIAREKYRAGEGLMLDIIDAQLALSTARLNHISAQYDYARYKAEVENEMGIGLNDSEKSASGQLVTDAARVIAASPLTKAQAAQPVAPARASASQDARRESRQTVAELAGSGAAK